MIERKWTVQAGRLLPRQLETWMILAVVFLCSPSGHAQWNGAGVAGGTGGADFNDVANWTGGAINGSFVNNSGTTSLQFEGDSAVGVSSLNFNSTSSIVLTLGTGTLLSGSGPATINLSGDIASPTVKGSRVVLGGGNTGFTGTGSDLILNLSDALHSVTIPAAYSGSGNDPVVIINAKITGGGSSTMFQSVGGYGNTQRLVLTNNNSDFTGMVKAVAGGIYYTSIADRGVASSVGKGASTGTDIYLDSSGWFSYIGSGNQSGNRVIGSSFSAAGNNVYLTNYASSPSILTLSGAINVYNSTGSNTYNLRATPNNTIVLSGNIVQSGAGALNLAIGATFGSGYYDASGNYTTSAVPSGTVILSGNNSYTGTTSLNSGSLIINSATALGSGAFYIGASGGGAVTLDNTSGSTVSLANNNAQTWNVGFTFTGSNDLNLGTGAVTLSGNRTVTVNAKKLTVGGAISGAGYSVTKAGAGTLELSGVNTYTGTTTVSAGTLLVNGSLASGSAVSVASNALLGGRGTINGVTTMSGALALNDGGMGTLTVTNDVIWNSGQAWKFELGVSTGSSDLLLLTGAASDFLKGSGSMFQFDFQNTGVTGSFTLVDWDNAAATTFSVTDFSYTGLATGLTGSFSIEGSSLVFTAIPEPSVYALIGLGMISLGFLRRRRN